MSRFTMVLFLGVAMIGLVAARPASALNDPFGPAGNHSLAFDNFNGGTTTPGNSWPFAWWDLGADYSSAVVEFDLYMADDPDPLFWSYVDLRIGKTGGGIPSGVLNDTAIYDNYRVQGGNGAFYFENAVAPANGHPFTKDTAHHVKYVIDGAAKNYTVQVTPYGANAAGGFVQKDAGSDTIIWRAGFQLAPPFGAGHTGFNVLAIGTAFGPGSLPSSPFYLDNLKVTSGGQTVLDENFDDDAVGGLPNTGNYIGANTNGSDLEVVGAVPEPSSLGVAAVVLSVILGRRGFSKS
ncbi:MAG: hypothetical protein O3C60_09560 [Planctomycetota bacterium]|nr:hypothetical protein [Planctomycetota bacterium]